MTLARYWHTARYLRPVQLYGRVWYRLRRPVLDRRSAPALRSAADRWGAPSWREPSLLAPHTFRALGETRDITSAHIWEDAAASRLWLYNLHYFDDLTARDAHLRRPWHGALVTRWLTEHPAGSAPGWEPYPTSLRLANWIKAHLAADSGTGERLTAAAIESVAVQTRWLTQRIEHHIQANHLWANAKALTMAGCCFAGPEADEWREMGVRLLTRELVEQILPDGGHYERSPMYHAIVLEDVLDLLETAGCFPNVLPGPLSDTLREVAQRMLRWLRCMTHPDGEIAFFNDAAIGIAAPHAVLADYAAHLGVSIDRTPLAAIEALPDSGYVRLSTGRAVMFCDVAPVGPDHQPGHAHADTLSFELSIDDQRCLVNSGTSTYAAGPLRQFQRSTRAHNTVVVDDEDSSEVWGGFRVARRARVLSSGWGTEDGALVVRGVHDGYHRLTGRVQHRRRWQLGTHELSVTDELDGTWRTAEAVWLRAPGAAGERARLITTAATGRDEQAHWYPRFGEQRDTVRTVVPFTGTRLTTVVRWE